MLKFEPRKQKSNKRVHKKGNNLIQCALSQFMWLYELLVSVHYMMNVREIGINAKILLAFRRFFSFISDFFSVFAANK